MIYDAQSKEYQGCLLLMLLMLVSMKKKLTGLVVVGDGSLKTRAAFILFFVGKCFIATQCIQSGCWDM